MSRRYRKTTDSAPVLGLTASTTQDNPHHFIVKQYFCEDHEGRVIPRPSVARSMMPHAKFVVYASYDESNLVIEQYYFLKQSTIPNAGFGLFAARNFTPHEIVAWYTGKEISKDIALDPTYDSDKIIELEDKCIDARADNWYSLAQFVNDFSRGTERGQNLHFEHDGTLSAKRDIRKGEELFVSYGKTYWNKPVPRTSSRVRAYTGQVVIDGVPMVQALAHSSLAQYPADAQRLTAVWMSMHPVVKPEACAYIKKVAQNIGYTLGRHLSHNAYQLSIRHADIPLSLLRCVFEIHNKACDYITSQYGVVVQRLRPFNPRNPAYNQTSIRLAANDLFITQYTPSTVASLDFHRDGTKWAYVVGLDHSTSGGTVFKNVLATQHPLVQQTGYMSIHNGQCLHGSSPVLRGERTVLVGFIKQVAGEMYCHDDTGKDSLHDDVACALMTHK